MASRQYEISAKYERRLRDYLEDMGYFVVRGGGSLTMDLVATPPSSQSFLIEVKTTTDNAYYPNTSGKPKRQWYTLKGLDWLGFKTCYAVRFRHQGRGTRSKWDLFFLDELRYPKPLRQGEGLSIDEAFGDAVP